jgi:HAD superfamily hydrolase (TIGR01458 family)
LAIIKTILFDISDVLYDDKAPVKGAVDAINQLQYSGIPLRFVTNSSRSTEVMILTTLQKMGFAINDSQAFTAPSAIKQFLQIKKLRPYCLIHPDLEPEFAEFEQLEPRVVADAAERFDYNRLNSTFELPVEGAPLIGIGRNRYFKNAGKLCLNAGPFIQALEYAAGVEAQIMGKPAPEFFMVAFSSVDCMPEEVFMIGDDAEADVERALKARLQTCLVQTGKYRQGDKSRLLSLGGECVPSVVEVITPFL